MERVSFLLLLVALLISMCGCSRLQRIEADLVFIDVNVIPMNIETVLTGQSVFVKGDTIVEIGASDAFKPMSGAILVYALGKYLMPALADMHVHLESEADLPLYVANGVTLVRNMWGEPETLAMRESVASGNVLGPRIVTAGRLTDGDPPVWGADSAVARTPDDAKTLMDEQQAAGFDLFKIYSRLSLETFDAVANYSREIGFPFAGHVPDEVSLKHALTSGIASIEHLTGWNTAVRREDGPYKTRAELPNRAERTASRVAIAEAVSQGELSWDDVFVYEEATRLSALSADKGVWNVPTLSVNRRIYTSRRQAEKEFNRPEMRFIAPDVRASWNPSTDFRLKDTSDEQLEAQQIYFEHDLNLVKTQSEANAPLLVGTDAPNPFVLHGFAIHEELELFVRAGLTPYAALSAATTAPAIILGEADRFGSLQRGMRADIVLLDENPLVDISATRSIAGVMIDGVWHSRDELNAVLEAIANSYEVPDNWFEGDGALPAADSEITAYALSFNDVENGAERFVVKSAGEGKDIVAQRREKLFGENAFTTIRMRVRPDGLMEHLHYNIESSSAKADASVTVADGVVKLEGHSIDGSSASQSFRMPDSGLLLCGFTSCLYPVAAALDGLPDNQSLVINAVVLKTFGGVRLEPESWKLTRLADKDGARIFSGVIKRRSEESELLLVIDDEGVKSQRIVRNMGVMDAHRTID